MATRRDQLQSYQFLLQRVVSALVYRKTDPAQSPFRSAGGAIFAGIMLSVLALAVTALIGLFATGCGRTADWKNGDAIIRAKETGALYVIFPKKEDLKKGQRQTLYGVENFSSAALLVGTTEVFDIKSQSLQKNEGVDMGPTVGIQGAPDTIPTADALSAANWALCSLPPSGSQSEAQSKLFIGTTQPKGKTVANAHAIFVKAGEDTYMVSEGHKHKVENADENEDIVFYFNAADNVRTVDQAYVDGIETGEPLRIPDVGDTEKESAVDGYNNGAVIEQQGSGNTTYWVATKDGAAEITQMQAELINKKFDQQSEEGNISPADKTDSLKPTGSGAPPENVSKIEKPSKSKPLCASFPATGKQTKFLYDSKLPNINGVTTPATTDSGATLADQIVVAPGSGALVKRKTGADTGDLALVTADGQIFGISKAKPKDKENGAAAPASALDALGFNAEGEKPESVKMPAQLLALIPEGPELDPERAMDTLAKARSGE